MSSKVKKPQFENELHKVVKKYSRQKEPYLKALFARSGISYPPRDIALLAFKKERILQLWAKTDIQPWHHIHTYPLTAFSGHLGPKLKEYDKQIPEGVYKITSLNPTSSMHLSMMLNYPNAFDKLHANQDGRYKLGGDIFVHGKASSVGCLAIGDSAIEQLFLLVYRIGINHAEVIIAPNDLRQHKPATLIASQPQWVPNLYQQITKALNHFPLQTNPTHKIISRS